MVLVVRVVVLGVLVQEGLEVVLGEDEEAWVVVLEVVLVVQEG